jgi:hypothetical protein
MAIFKKNSQKSLCWIRQPFFVASLLKFAKKKKKKKKQWLLCCHIVGF